MSLISESVRFHQKINADQRHWSFSAHFQLPIGRRKLEPPNYYILQNKFLMKKDPITVGWFPRKCWFSFPKQGQ
jgi:hypothetical protein